MSDGWKRVQDLFDTGEWEYCGGDNGPHLKKWKLFTQSKPGWNKPKHKNYCVCGHYIVNNCYIYNKGLNKIKILGSCCVKKFTNFDLLCEDCNQPHKNRKVNRCNKCRKGKCDKCGGKCSECYKVCYKCKFMTN